jgi:hypothetical protein
LGVVVLAALALGLNGAAHALPCSVGSVSGSVACGDGAPNDQNDEAADLDGLFGGLTGWMFLQKDELPGLDTNVDINLVVTVDGGGQAGPSGTCEFNPDTWNSYAALAIVIKDGRQAGDVFWSAYLLDNTLQPSSGTWDTGGPDLSHLSVHGVEGCSDVPEPATLFLVGAGLIGLAVHGRRKPKP